MMEGQINQSIKPYNFPQQPTSFIGRDDELGEIIDMLSEPTCRLLTLIGSGGMGKTRLAVQAAQKMVGQFEHGIYFVPVQPIRSADLLVSAVAKTINFSRLGQNDLAVQLLNYLQDKEMLLVMDNFEPWLDGGVDFLIDILQNTPTVKILVTSREILNMQEEWLYPVPGLEYPCSYQPLGSGEASDNNIEDYSAVQLFTQRARRVRYDFSLANEKRWVAQICQLLEGIPLAIELAAAWTKTLRCEVIAAEIEHNLDFLSTSLRNVPERQQSMRAVFDQSWKLLTEQERSIFKRLAVFRDGFRREAAEQVANASLASLSGLADKSLLRLEPDGRYHVHELLRQYAGEHLVQSAEAVACVYDSHCAYYAQFLHQRLGDMLGGRQKEVKAEIEADFENIRLAWQWAIELVKVEEIRKSALAMALFYQIKSRYAEGVMTFEKAACYLDMTRPTGQQGVTLAEILVVLGWLHIRVGQLEKARIIISRSQAIFAELDMVPPPGLGTDPRIPLAILEVIQGDYARAVELGEQARQAAETRVDSHNLSFAYYVLATATRAEGQYQAANHYGQQACATAKVTGNYWFLAYCLSELGNVAVAMDEYSTAKGYYEASYAIHKEFDDPEGIAIAINHLGKIATLQQDKAETKQLYQQSLSVYRQINDKSGLARALTALGMAAAALEDFDKARHYYLEALQIATEMQFKPLILTIVLHLGELFWQNDQRKRGIALLALVRNHPASDSEVKARSEHCLLNFKAELAPDKFEAAVEQGRHDSLEKIVTVLQAELTVTPDYDSPEDGVILSLQEIMSGPEQPLVEPLTAREFEVLHLIAQGMTNQQMADELIISVGTAKWYTSQIYGKLQVNNRTQAVARARELELLVWS